ncbi:MAG: carboxymuconolactone decarboxylase family protein [Streptosporangiaceae bacterium]
MSGGQRLSVREVDPDAIKAMLEVERYVHAGGLEEGLLAMVKMRASQINGCAWCLDMHAAEAREAGVRQRQLDVLAAWREAGSLFSARERAALAFTESVTLISVSGVPEEVWRDVAATFDEKETVRLLMAIGAINVWNRLNVATRQEIPPDPATRN